MNRKGFTLIELIVVIAIIAILAAVVAPTAMRSVDRARASSTIEDYQAIKSAAFSYNTDCGNWPTAVADFTVNPGAAGCATNSWDGPYMDRFPSSRWAAAGVTVTWVNTAAGGVVCGAAGPERYITIPNIPNTIATAGSARARIDTALDNGDQNAAGIVRENAGAFVMCISRG
jgi:general secretion pathway protein G